MQPKDTSTLTSTSLSRSDSVSASLGASVPALAAFAFALSLFNAPLDFTADDFILDASACPFAAFPLLLGAGAVAVEVDMVYEVKYTIDDW